MNYTDRGLSITEMTTGVDVAGLDTYKESLKLSILTNVETRINDVQKVISALDKAWQGESRDVFDKLFEDQRNRIIEDLEAEYKDIEYRLEELAVDYLNQDKALLAKVEGK